MRIKPFAIEQWMNEHEEEARWNLGETCVESFRLSELLELSDDPDGIIQSLRGLKLTYGHICGSPELRGHVARLYGSGISSSKVLIASGAIGANFLVYYSLVEPGDTVISVSPTYQQLYSVAESLGATVKILHLRRERGYLPDIGELRSLVDDKTRLIVINNPNNPTGALMGETLMREIVSVAEECGAYVHCDEVYRGLEHEPESQGPSIVSLYEQGISTGSMSKAFSLAGLRTGWLVASSDVLSRVLEHRDYTTISCGAVDDVLAAVALANADKILARNVALLQRNAAVLGDWIRSEPRLDYVPPRAGTTALVEYGYPLPSVEFCEGLLRHNGTFVAPGSCFDCEGTFRVGFGCAAEVLDRALEGISGYLRLLDESEKGRFGPLLASPRAS
jgi:aspartate/methionine/tyrosine aminotransferase